MCRPAVLFVVALAAAAGRSQDAGPRLTEHVRALSGKDVPARRAYVQEVLEACGARPERQPVKLEDREGANVLWRRAGRGPACVLAAHLDCRPFSPGANDDASGCAVLLELAAGAAKDADPGRRALCFLFADGGIHGQAGTRAFLDAWGGEPLAGALVLDMVGVGDRLVAGPVSPLRDDAVVRLLEAALGAGGADPGPGVVLLEDLPDSEHRVFRRRGVDAALLTLCPREELEAFRLYAAAPDRCVPPRVIRLTLSTRDSAARLQEAALRRALDGARRVLAALQAAELPGRMPNKDLPELRRRLDTLLGQPGGGSGEALERAAASAPRELLRAAARHLEARPGALGPLRETLGALMAPGLAGMLAAPGAGADAFLQGLREIAAAGPLVWEPRAGRLERASSVKQGSEGRRK